MHLCILLTKEAAKNGARESGFELKIQNMEVPGVEAMVCAPFLTQDKILCSLNIIFWVCRIRARCIC